LCNIDNRRVLYHRDLQPRRRTVSMATCGE
jgi:hypothetical protein